MINIQLVLLSPERKPFLVYTTMRKIIEIIDIGDIVSIHKYLMKKHDIV